jgi:hypothetical protein
MKQLLLSDEFLLTSWHEAEARGLCMGDWCHENKYPVYTTIPRMHEILEHITVSKTPFDIISSIPSTREMVWPSFMVVGDVQIPTTDWNLARMVGYVAEKRMKKPRRMIIDGDLLNFDCWSSYPQILMSASWKEEKEACRAVLYMWLETFDEIIWLFGNHELRKLKAAQGVEDETDILSMLRVPEKRIKVSVLDHCIVKTPIGPWRVCHGDDYSQGLLVKADAYAQKYQMHIVAAHAHRFGLGVDRFNRYMIVSSGGLFDSNKMAYTQIGTNARPSMAQGFTLINNGYPEMYSPLMTNWETI